MKIILNRINKEVINYIIVGILTTLVNLLSYTLLYKILKIDVTVSNIISVSISILFAYITNRIYVFHSKETGFNNILIEMSKFCGARVSTMIIEVGGVFLLHNLLGIHPMISKLFTQVIVIVGNYFISKFLVFNQ